MKRVTLRDIASSANVSLATVDRVLNGRAGVSEETEARVRNAISELKLSDRRFASASPAARPYHFSFIIPRGPKNTFMVNMRGYVDSLIPQMAAQGIQLTGSDYAELDEQELLDALAAVDVDHCMGIALVAIDSVPVREAIDALVQAGVGVVTVVSDVTSSRRFFNVGPDNVAAGWLAASLMGRFAGRCPGKIGVIGSMSLRDQSDRRLGFEQVMAREYGYLEVLPVGEGRDDSAVTVELARKLLHDHQDLLGIYNIGAGNRGLHTAIEESGRKSEIAIVAHELTKHSRRALVSGTFDAVINQDYQIEVRNAIQALKAFVDSDVSAVPSPVHLDIYLRDNLP